MFTAWRPFLCSTWSSQRTDIRRRNGQASSPKGTNSKWGSMLIQFFFFIAMIHLIHMQQDLFVWQQLNVAAGLDFFVCFFCFFLGGGSVTKSMCGQYGGVVWVSKDQTGFNWYLCVWVRLVETGACNLCFFSIRNETKTNWIQTTTFQLSKKGFIGRDLKLATPTHKFRTRKVIFSGPLKTKFRI